MCPSIFKNLDLGLFILTYTIYNYILVVIVLEISQVFFAAFTKSLPIAFGRNETLSEVEICSCSSGNLKVSILKKKKR